MKEGLNEEYCLVPTEQAEETSSGEVTIYSFMMVSNCFRKGGPENSLQAPIPSQ
jgi:hypothetical protein